MATDSGLATRLGDTIRERVAVDTRALAAFRIALGTILVVDLLLRSRNLVAFYTDAGALPRGMLATQVGSIRHLSVHALSGGVWWQVVLFVVAGIAAVALAFGYRTTLATVVSFVLLVALHIRNPAILNGGDSLLRQLLLWGAFLPLGDRWSVDAVRRDHQRDRVASLATAAVLLQVVFVYASNAVFKFRGHAWPQGEAIHHVFALSRHVTPAARLVAEVPILLTVADYAWLALLTVSPLLLVLTGWRRAALAACYAGFHAGMIVFMELGIFPLVGVAALLPFVPGTVWDRLPAPPARVFERIDEYRPDRDWTGPRVRPHLRPLARGLVALLLVGMFAINAVSLGYVDAPEGAPAVVEDKAWDMFAPNPPTEDGYYVMPATLESGKKVDALQRAPVTWGPPRDVSSTFPTGRWRKLLYQLHGGKEARLREPIADYLCWRWNRHHDNDMVRVRMVYVTDPIDGSAGRRYDYGTYRCG